MKKMGGKPMKVNTGMLIVLLAVISCRGQEPAGAARTFCRFIPERLDDFAWENDVVAFRVYGPALRGKGVNSGIDCWFKRGEHPMIDKLYTTGAKAGVKKC